MRILSVAIIALAPALLIACGGEGRESLPPDTPTIPAEAFDGSGRPRTGAAPEPNSAIPRAAHLPPGHFEGEGYFLDESRLAITSADVWPMFRGSTYLTGMSAAQLPETLEEVWSFEAGDAIDSSAAIVGDGVYFTAFDGFVYALDFNTGEVRWKFDTENPMSASPAVRFGRVYVGDEYGFFHALDAATGEEVWRFETGAEILSSANVLNENEVLFGSYDNFLYSLNPATGALNWKFETEGPVHCTPGVVEGHKAFVTGCDGVLRTIDITRRGVEIQGFEFGGNVGASPAYYDGHIYFGDFNNTVLAYDVPGNDITWEYDPEPKDFPFNSSAGVTHDRIILGGRDKLIHCIERETGKPIWAFQTLARVESSPVIIGDRVFIGSSDGTLYELSLETGEERWRFTAGGPIVASPAVARGRLIVGTQDGILYCLGSKGARPGAAAEPTPPLGENP